MISIYEASDFWDEHYFTEFEDVKEVKDIRFTLTKKKYIGVDNFLSPTWRKNVSYTIL